MKHFRILFYLYSIFMLSASALNAQITVSYTLPDIVAPGMNMYMEIISPYNQIGTFGADTTFLNVPGDTLSISFINPTDAEKITFGPLVVSWQGRMIATQVFAHPNLMPNSWDWSAVNPQFVIPIRINKNGVFSNVFNLYIVQPFQFGDKSASTERVLGEGSLGKRSRRGAMIVDEMTLANDKYTVSTNDCDPSTPGNQGYLPFILMVKKDIVGSANSSINVSGGRSTSSRYQDAGVGGGGGGGRFFDAGFACSNGDNGDDGGNGFTGGGAGGRNRNGFGSDALKSQGIGSFELAGVIGYSLNEIPPSFTPNVYEAAGGSTGHPFGLSGYACNDGNNCNPEGQYGAGSGYRQNNPGGSGGNATVGQGPSLTGGKVVGNPMLTPLAGGSGAASGNPQFGFGCNFSGSGGGGGGAIVVFARKIINVQIYSQGGAGQNGVGSSNGGGGSGGAISTAAKLSVDNGISQSVFIDGGKAGGGTDQYGGWGRIRRDAAQWTVNIGTSAPPNVYFQGPSTDTVRYFKPNIPFTINGSKRNSDSLLLMLKPLSGDWTKLTVIPSGSTLWNYQLTLPKTDSVYYLVAMQYLPNPNKTSPYSAEADFVLSQAAANIFIAEKFPEIAGKDTVFVDSILACSGQSKIFRAKIYNIGEADLVLSSASFANSYFSLASPINNLIIPPNDSTEIQIVYTYNSAHPLQIIDSLIINHNDSVYTRPHPWIIHLRMKVIPLSVQNDFLTITRSSEKTLNLPNVKFYSISACLGENISIKAVVKNNSSVPLNLVSIDKSNPAFTTLITGDMLILPGDTCTYYINFNTAALGTMNGKFSYKFTECTNYLDSLDLSVSIGDVDFVYLDDGLFPETRVGQFNQKVIRLQNNGTRAALINAIANPGNGYSIVSVAPVLPYLLKPNETLNILVRFAPLLSGDPIQANLRVSAVASDSTCADIAELSLGGKAVESQIVVSKYLMDFDTLYTCDAARDTIYVSNPASSTVPIVFTSEAELLGSGVFQILSQPTMPVSINPGDTVMFVVEFSTMVSGTFDAQLVIHTDDISTPDVFVQIMGTRDAFDITVNPNRLDFGDVPLGSTQNRTVRVTNNGILPLNLTNAKISNNLIVSSITPSSGVIAANGGFLDLDVQVVISKALNSPEQYTLNFAECSRQSIHLADFNKLIASASFQSPLDFGILSGCEDSTSEVQILNNGNADFIILSDQIVGPDANLFSKSGQSGSYPYTLKPSEPFSYLVTFDPIATTNGVKNAKLLVTTIMNGDTTIIEIALLGEKQSAVITIPPEVVFTGTVVNTSKNQSLTIRNAGFFDVRLASIKFPTKYPGELNVTPDHTGAMLIANSGEIVFDVDFTPTNVGLYRDTIFLNISYNGCTETIAIALEGIGLPGRKISISLPKLEKLDPRLTNYSIPIFAKVDIDTISNFKLDTLEFRWDRSIFYPKSFVGGTILYNNVDGNARVLGVSIDNMQIMEMNSDTIIGEIIGDVLLGSTDFSLIELSKFHYTDSNRVSEIDTAWGSISIEVCPDGGKRFLNISNNPAGIVVTPNPVSGNAQIAIDFVEIGDHTLEIYDVLGNRLDVLLSKNHSLSDDSTTIINANFGNYSSGMYIIRLTTPTNIYSKIVAISL